MRLFPLSQNQGLVDQATNAQIDTLILDNRKKLNAIIGGIKFAVTSQYRD